MSGPIVAITGFNGQLATLITKNLLANHPDIKIHGIARSPEKVNAAIRDSPNVTVFEAGAFDSAALRRGLKGASVAVCCYLGNSELMVDGQKRLIDASIDEGVARYVASDWSMDYRGLELGQHPEKDPMIHIQAYLEAKEQDGRIKAIHILNGGFTNIVLGPFSGFFNPKALLYQYWGTGDEPLEMTTYEDSAAFTAEVIADPSATGFLNFLGDSKSVKEIAEIFEKVYGEKLRLECLGTLDDLKTKMAAIRQQIPDQKFKWIGMFYLYYMWKGSTRLQTLDNARYPGVKPLSVEEYFRQHSKESLSSFQLF